MCLCVVVDVVVFFGGRDCGETLIDCAVAV